MRSEEPAEAISARATGALFFTGFGSLWLCTGFVALGRLNIVTGAIVAMVAAALVAASLRLLRRAAKASPAEQDVEAGAEKKRVFRRGNTLRGIGIFAFLLLAEVFLRAHFTSISPKPSSSPGE